jgi:hypothetical protein
VRGGLVDGKLSRSPQMYMDVRASGVQADGAYVTLSLRRSPRFDLGNKVLTADVPPW